MSNVNSARRRWPWLVLGALAMVLVGAATTWAVLTVLRPPGDSLATKDYTFVEVVRGQVGESMTLNTVAEWNPVPAGENRAVGIVTGVSVNPGDLVSQGTTLYSVDLRPVVIAQGDIPAFRAIREGVEGPDVRQLQQLLATQGHYSLSIDGKVEAGTIAAIKRWQAALGLPNTGVVEAGDVIFVPSLPARISLDGEIVKRGATLTGGETVLSGLPEMPVLGIPVTDAQANIIPPGTRVEITAPDGATWTARTTDVQRNADDGSVTIVLNGTDGEAVCANRCEQIPATGQTSLVSKIITIETVTGLVVPSSALMTTADGQTVVIGANAKRIPVEILASAKGMSIIDGVNDGTNVRVPATDGGGR